MIRAQSDLAEARLVMIQQLTDLNQDHSRRAQIDQREIRSLDTDRPYGPTYRQPERSDQ